MLGTHKFKQNLEREGKKKDATGYPYSIADKSASVRPFGPLWFFSLSASPCLCLPLPHGTCPSPPSLASPGRRREVREGRNNNREV